MEVLHLVITRNVFDSGCLLSSRERDRHPDELLQGVQLPFLSSGQHLQRD